MLMLLLCFLMLHQADCFSYSLVSDIALSLVAYVYYRLTDSMIKFSSCPGIRNVSH